MLTPEDVLNTSFTQTQFREGYEEREVDEFLDDVVASLRHLDGAGGSGGDAPRRLLTADAVGAVRFTPTRYRRGYDMAEVDALLERVVAELATREGGGHPSPAPVDGRAAAPAAATATTTATGPTPVSGGGLGARVLRLLRGDPRP